MGYVVGLDGGGTKTAVQIRSMDHLILKEIEIGSLNYNGRTKEELEQTIQELVHHLNEIPGGISGCQSICISTAGVSNQDAVDWLTNQIRSCGIEGILSIVGDQKAALAGALEGAEGIVLISGTGSICYGENGEGQSCRSGGYGYLIDDEGSGYAIGRDILTAAVRSVDGREASDLLYSLVLEQIGGNKVEDIIRYTYQQKFDKANIAKLAPLLVPSYEQKDEAAIRIVQKAASELAKLVVPVAKKLSLEQGKIAFLGGILQHYGMIREQLIAELAKVLPELTVSEAMSDSVTGAANLALAQLQKKKGAR